MDNIDEPYNLQRFVDAQNPVYDRVCAELRVGRKQTHWMWFVFPQIQGLGESPVAQHYAITSLAEARAYLSHTVLGKRLRECTELVNFVERHPIRHIFGYPDYLKFRSSMSLFARAAEDNKIFVAALDKYFDGEYDPLTIQCLQRSEQQR